MTITGTGCDYERVAGVIGDSARRGRRMFTGSARRQGSDGSVRKDTQTARNSRTADCVDEDVAAGSRSITFAKMVARHMFTVPSNISVPIIDMTCALFLFKSIGYVQQKAYATASARQCLRGDTLEMTRLEEFLHSSPPRSQFRGSDSNCIHPASIPTSAPIYSCCPRGID